MSTAMPEYRVCLQEKREIAKNVLELRFSKPDGFSFAAGQFVQFLVPNKEKQVPRTYSLASTPNDPHLEFCVKLLPNGLASAMFERMNENEEASIRGPRGRFVAHAQAVAHYFVATGAGLAPIMGIIRDELEQKKSDKEIRLLFGVRSEENLFWTDRLEALAQAHERFRYYVTLSQPNGEASWTGLKGRVTDHILHHLTDHMFYLCGSAEMVKDVRALLLEEGIPVQNITFEIF